MDIASTKVFEIDDIKKIIFDYLPLRCRSCKTIMHRKYVDSNIHRYYDINWRRTENKYCRNYCNWCCIYVFNHSR